MMNNKIRVMIGLLLTSLNLAADTTDNAEMVVYRSASCSCCGKWLDHLKQNQIKFKTVMSDDMSAIKEKLGIPDKLASCHTGVVDGYVIEGHVPAEDIKNLLHTKPNLAGIAAPGMPLGSPGMEVDNIQQAYKVISFDEQGKLAVFAEHGGL